MCSPDPETSSLTHYDTAWRAGVEAALHTAGLRHSSARATVLDWIAGAARPFTAETIVQQLVDAWGVGSRPTVYRTVDWLRGAGWLARLHGDGVDRTYARCLPGGHQLVCTGCGVVQTLTGVDLTPLLDSHLRALGFELRAQHLELYGRCLLCQAAPVQHVTHVHEDMAS